VKRRTWETEKVTASDDAPGPARAGPPLASLSVQDLALVRKREKEAWLFGLLVNGLIPEDHLDLVIALLANLSAKELTNGEDETAGTRAADRAPEIREVEEQLFGEPYASLAAKIKRDERLGRAVKAVEEDYRGAGLTVEIMADTACMCSRLLRCRFSRLSGLSPHQFLTRYRVMKAVELLQGTSLGILEIAERAGFDEVRTLERNFKRLLGRPPRRFRKKADCAH
jgi:AraC-like DNA-binding protein